MKFKVIVALLLLMGSIPLLLASNTVILSAGLTLGPYIISPTSGIEVDIVREAFETENKSIKVITLPFQRSKESFKEGFMDGVLTVSSNNPIVKGSYFSKTYITYENIIVTLGRKNLNINSIQDLNGISVVGFQQAAVSLGDEFREFADGNVNYRELSNQLNQVEMLFRGHIGAAVIDINIFKFLRNQLPESIATQPVKFHRIFGPTNYQIAFSKKEVRDSFDRGLKRVKSSGRYDKIVQKYITRPLK